MGKSPKFDPATISFLTARLKAKLFREVNLPLVPAPILTEKLGLAP
jgi:hypothetical protein